VEEENPVEKAHEDLHEKAEHSREPWIGRVALTAALLAGIAAIASSLSGHHESEGILEQIKASLRRFGQQKPIVVDATNVVRAGNGTLAAAKALGWTNHRRRAIGASARPS